MKKIGKVVLVEPHKVARITELDLSLENMQKTVGGSIEIVYPFDDEVGLVCNEEGKILELDLNRAIMDDETGEIADIIAGTFFICGLGGEDLTGLTDEQAELYLKMFKHEEWFLKWDDDALAVVKVFPAKN